MGCKAVYIWEAEANTVNTLSHMGSDCLLHRGCQPNLQLSLIAQINLV